jgi:hypothetical protein
MFESPRSMLEDKIAAIVRQLQEPLSELKETKNRDMRLTLLRHMRLLLFEADRAVDEARAESAQLSKHRDFTQRPGQGGLLW